MGAILAIDTSSACSSIALQCGDGRIFDWQGRDPNSHNELLAPRLEALLRQAQLRPEQLSLLLNGGGPGSFTGLRISLSLLKGMALSLHLPLLSCSSLAAAAASISFGEADLVFSVADARRAELFAGAYDPRDNFQPLDDEQIVPLAGLEGFVNSLCAQHKRNHPVLCILPADPQLAGLPGHIPAQTADTPARGLLRIAQAAAASARFDPAALSALTPRYLRAVAAKTIAERRVNKGP